MADDIQLCLIVARARNAVIGQHGDLPWRLAEDLKFFKRVTKGCPLIMGRKTWESLPRRPLPGRANLVVSRNARFEAGGGWLYADIAPAVAAGRAMARVSGADAVYVIGGEALYGATLGLADRLFITEVDAAPDGDAIFPPLDEAGWSITEHLRQGADERHDHAFVIRQWDRKR